MRGAGILVLATIAPNIGITSQPACRRQVRWR